MVPNRLGAEQLVPDWSGIARTQWLPEALVAARDLTPTYRDLSAFTPRSAP